ncbi:MAG TPA: DUF1643 domain-containing protein [Nostocaceae cyanobacterium]|nr:DUF1643 domain-containing protein [Nostocaceae cyanobacterium]
MEIKRDAKIVGQYRYLLSRKWDENLPQVTFVMLNPSKANAYEDDPTITRCINFAHSWGYGCLEVVNLFAYISTDPRELGQVNDPVGAKNNDYIQLAVNQAKLIILAWGAGKYPQIQNRNQEVLKLIYHQPLYCLGATKDGHPRHPLYLRNSTKPMIFTQP